MNRNALIYFVLCLACGCHKARPGEKFSVKKCQEFIQKLPGHNPSLHVTNVEIWDFKDPSKNFFTSHENLSSVATLKWKAEGKSAQKLALGIWEELLKRTGEHTMKKSNRFFSKAILFSFDDGEAGYFILNYLNDEAGKIHEAEARVGNSLIPVGLDIDKVLGQP